MDLIISHRNCPDGFCAAWIASKCYPRAEILLQDHGVEPPYDRVEGRDVLVTDYSWRTREINDKMAQLAKSLTILDHHKTAQATLDGAPYATFDMDRSGAGLAWDYLFGKDSTGIWTRDREERECGVDSGTPRPWYVNYVEDRDLWNWKLLASRQVNAYIGTLPFTFDAWALLDCMTVEEAATRGEGALDQINHYVANTVEQRQMGTLDGMACAVVNAQYSNISEVGNELVNYAKIGMGWFERGDGMIQFSLRSTGDTDVSRIAKRLGGGGHQHAAGFQMGVKEGRRFVDLILDRPVLL